MTKEYICPKCRSNKILPPGLFVKDLRYNRKDPDVYECEECGYAGIFLIKENLKPNKDQ